MMPASPVLALLHATARVSLTEWSVHPSTVIGLAALGAVYTWGAVRTAADTPVAAGPVVGRAPRRGTAAGRPAMFAGGLLAIFLSLNGPLHDVSDAYLFSAHMVQHLVLTLVAPPLLLAGTPGRLLRPLLRHRSVRSLAARLTRPIACYAIFNITVAVWHLPLFYNTAVLSHPVHIVQHLTFMAAAVLMWWPILSPLPELPRLSYPGQMLYSFLLTIPMSVIAIYIAYADTLLYPGYASAPRLWGLSPMDDQMLGGLIMWIPGGLFFVGVMTVIFFRWVGRDSDAMESAQVRA